MNRAEHLRAKLALVSAARAYFAEDPLEQHEIDALNAIAGPPGESRDRILTDAILGVIAELARALAIVDGTSVVGVLDQLTESLLSRDVGE